MVRLYTCYTGGRWWGWCRCEEAAARLQRVKRDQSVHSDLSVHVACRRNSQHRHLPRRPVRHLPVRLCKALTAAAMLYALAYSPLGHLGHAPPPLAPAAEKSATKQRP